MEAVCIIQRSTDIVEPKKALRYLLITMVADASWEIASADAVGAIRSMHGVEEGSFSIVPFFPEQFIVHCRSRETCNRILATPAVPTVGTSLVLWPWTRLAQADASALHCKVSLELEGIPTHAWN
jgi:hypothetical protein